MERICIRHARKEDAAWIAEVQIETWRSAYREVVSDSYLRGLDKIKRTIGWNDAIDNSTDIILVAERNGIVIGFTAGGKSREKSEYDGEILAFYVLAEHQGRWIGSKLFRAMLEEFWKVWYNSFYLWVLEMWPARKFYEYMGGKFIDEKYEEIWDSKLCEVSYGWQSIGSKKL